MVTFGHVPVNHILEDVSWLDSIQDEMHSFESTLNEFNTEYDKFYKEVKAQGMEGLFSDVVTTAVKTPINIAKAGKKLYVGGDKGYQELRRQWERVLKPMLGKVFKEMAGNMQTMYFKYTKLDKQWKELGINLNYVVDHQMKHIGDMPTVKLFIHDSVDPATLNKLFNVIQNFDKFAGEHMSIADANYKGFDTVIDLIKNNRINDIKELNNKINEKIQNFTDNGLNVLFADIIKSMASDRKAKSDYYKELKKRGVNEVIKELIIGPQLTMDFGKGMNNTLQSRVETYLKTMRSLIKSDVIGKTLSDSGKDIKKTSSEIIKSVESLQKLADEVNTKNKPQTNNNPQGNPFGETKGEINKNLGDGVNVRTAESEIDHTQDDDETPDLSREVGAFIANTIKLLTSITSAYQGFVGGTLSGIYEMVNDTNRLVQLIRQAAGGK